LVPLAALLHLGCLTTAFGICRSGCFIHSSWRKSHSYES
jgi:hypothetical protein